MNVNNFNKMTNKEKFEFILHGGINLIDYISDENDTIDVMNLLYDEKSDTLEIYSTYTGDRYDVEYIEYNGDNYFNVKTDEYLLELESVKFVKAFNEDGSIKKETKETIMEIKVEVGDEDLRSVKKYFELVSSNSKVFDSLDNLKDFIKDKFYHSYVTTIVSGLLEDRDINMIKNGIEIKRGDSFANISISKFKGIN